MIDYLTHDMGGLVMLWFATVGLVSVFLYAAVRLREMESWALAGSTSYKPKLTHRRHATSEFAPKKRKLDFSCIGVNNYKHCLF